jgi:hypothetical protein
MSRSSLILIFCYFSTRCSCKYIIYRQELFDDFCLRMWFAKNKALRKYNIHPFWLSLPKTKIIWFFNMLTLNIPDKGYSRNNSCLYIIYLQLHLVLVPRVSIMDSVWYMMLPTSVFVQKDIQDHDISFFFIASHTYITELLFKRVQVHA